MKPNEMFNVIISFIVVIFLTSIIDANIINRPNKHGQNNNLLGGGGAGAGCENSYKLVLFSFDGFRPDYIDPKRTPNLYAISQSGVQGKMLSTFATKTFPNHQSIATGLYQPYHGVINNNFYDPKLNQTFNVDNSSIVWWDQNNISTPIYIANQLYEPDRYSVSIQWPGSISFYSDGKNLSQRYRVHYLQDYDDKIDWFKRIDLLMKWLNDPEKPANLAFVYYSEPDAHAHQYGPFSDQVYEQVINLDKVVRYFREKLIENNLAPCTNVIYLSDHGMAEIHADRSMYLDRCNKEFPGLSYQVYGSSPVLSILPVSGPKNLQASSSSSEDENPKTVAESVRTALNQCAERFFRKKFKAFLQEEIPESFHYTNNSRILPVFLMADEGYDINFVDRGWRPAGYPIWGNHGYNASLPSMRPLFLAEGPRFKRQYKHPQVFENIDLYPLMLNLLDIPQNRFPNNNGTFEHVHQMLSKQLYLNVLDVLAQQSKNYTSSVWIKLFLYLISGFSLIFIAGSCFVFVAGINRHQSSSSSSSMDRSSKSSKMSNILRRIWNKNRNNHLDGPSYHMFANERPLNHLDSSSTSSFDDDDLNDHHRGKHNSDEYELFRKPRDRASGGGGGGSGGHKPNQLTDIDWDIIGTGLDIDLSSSQLDDGKGMLSMQSSGRVEYLNKPHQTDDDGEQDDDVVGSSENNVAPIARNAAKESVSLLIQDQDDEDEDEDEDYDPRKDEEIKAKINIEEYEQMLFKNDDDHNSGDHATGRRQTESNRLIDI